MGDEMASSMRRTTGSIRRGLLSALVPIWLAAVHGCGAQFPAAPAAANKEPEGCRVSGRIVSTAWRDLGGQIERAIVRAWTLPESQQAAEFSGEGEGFEVHLPPGRYRLVCSAVGTRGATFEVLSREITIAADQESLEVGEVDLPISKTTGLYGQPAPELGGIIAWHDTPPLALQDLKGKVVVLDFFGYYCSICHAHKPDLVKLRDQYKDQGLVVLAVHDASLKTLEEMKEKMGPVLRQVFNGAPPRLPMALDGAGEHSVFQAYGIDAVPAVILIDQQGRVVRRYHHAGKRELEADVRTLLSAPSQLNLQKTY
jgi:thiol-disulfide isomerase/thioredoxin